MTSISLRVYDQIVQQVVDRLSYVLSDRLGHECYVESVYDDDPGPMEPWVLRVGDYNFVDVCFRGDMFVFVNLKEDEEGLPLDVEISLSDPLFLDRVVSEFVRSDTYSSVLNYSSNERNER